MADGYKGELRYAQIAAYKARRITRVIKNRTYPEVIGILQNLPHKGAKIIKKLLQSIASNALYQNRNLDEEKLRLVEIQINEGPRIKRMWPRGRGRADVLVKKQSHIKARLERIEE